MTARRSVLGLVTTVLTLLVLASPARADEDDEDASPSRSWYGWQTLTADGAAVLVLPTVATQMTTNEDTIVLLTIGTWAVASPTVHLFHERPAMAFASLGVRVALPVTGAVLGAAADKECHGEGCLPAGPLFGAVLGMLGASAIDAAVFAFEPRSSHDDDEARNVDAARRAATAINFRPSIAPRREGGIDVGLGATF